MAAANIYKSAGILIKDQKLLVVRGQGKEFFISPGGKIEDGETAEEALVRELKEELSIDTIIEDFQFFGNFDALAVNDPDRRVYIKVFIVANWQGEPVASSEIEELAWVGSEDLSTVRIGSIFAHEVIPRLKEKNLIS